MVAESVPREIPDLAAGAAAARGKSLYLPIETTAGSVQRSEVTLPPALGGRWCRFTVRLSQRFLGYGRLAISDAGRQQVVREVLLSPRSHGGSWRCRSVLQHVPRDCGGLSLTLFGGGNPSPRLSFRPVSRPLAALRLLVRAIPALPAALRGSPLGLLGRVRATAGRGGRPEAPPYRLWLALFDQWSEADRAALTAAASAAPPIRVVIIARPGMDGEAVAVSLAAAAAQWWPSARAAEVIRTAAEWSQMIGGTAADEFVAVLGAGEMLAPHALAVVAAALARRPELDAVTADHDVVTADGIRSDPEFRPTPNLALLRSGTQSRGLWLFRQAAIANAPAPRVLHPDLLRLEFALRLAEAATPPRWLRLPWLLTHVRPDLLPPPAPEALRQVVEAHLARSTGGTILTPVRGGFRIAPERGCAPSPPVSVIIPSACRSGHVLRCLHKVLERTDYSDLEVIVAVSAIDPHDRRQASILRHIGSLPRLRLFAANLPEFNFARINNQAADQAAGELLLLLNDDVAPINPDWLSQMVLRLSDSRVGAVGAQLYYGNGMVQHAGVILGLGNLCEHNDRFARRNTVSEIDREVSAVTAACLLVRKSAFDAIGGFDEDFAIALNDVDLCMRLRNNGQAIVHTPAAELYHYESLSLGRHYSGDRAVHEVAEVRELRRRWGEAIADDPFYNPNLSVQLGMEWTPAFPPRVTRNFQ